MAALRNSINMRTGAISWRSMTPFEIFAFAFQGAVPTHGVQPLLHEFAAHYWCTNTPVSRAIQMRWLDYARRTAELCSTDAFAVHDEAAYVRNFDPALIATAAELRGIEACLRPFAEGIATFAEFDFFPPPERHRPSVPYLTQICSMLGSMAAASVGQAVRGVSATELAGLTVKSARTAQATIHRKADLLCHPLARGGTEECYLVGYALVKGIWRRVRERYGDTLDIEAVISFLIYHVYWDWRIVDLLVSNERPQPAQVMGLVASSIEELCAGDFLARYQAWDQWQTDLETSGQWESGRHDEMPFHGLSTADIRAIKRKGAAFAVDRLASPHAPGLAAMLAIPRGMLDLCTLFATDVRVEVDRAGVLRLFLDTGNGIAQVGEMQPSDPIPAQAAAGTLSVYGTFRPAGAFSLITSLRFGRHQITLGGRGPAVSRNDWMRNTDALLKNDARCHDDFATLCDTIEFTIDQIDRRSGNVIGPTVASAEAMAMKRYRHLLRTLGGPTRSLIELAGRLPADEDDTGVRMLFPKSRQFDAYCLLGLAGSFTSSRDDLNQVFTAQNHDLAGLLQCAGEIARERGVQLIERGQDGALRAVL